MVFSLDSSRFGIRYNQRLGCCDLLEFNIEETGQIKYLAISPDGAMITAGDDGSTLKMWEMKTGQLIFGSFDGYWTGVILLEFSPDGNRLVSGFWTGNITIWNTKFWDAISEFVFGLTNINFVRLSPDGTQFTSVSRAWDTEQGHVILILGPYHVLGHSGSLAFTRNGLHIYR
ncbi:hypothetical protein ACEPAH_9433 [Sanghuangporus vaninii]